MKIFYSSQNDSTYILGVDSYELLKFGIDLKPREYCNRARSYWFTGKEPENSRVCVGNPSFDDLLRNNYVEITEDNILEYLYNLPEVVSGVLYFYRKIDKNKYFRMSMAQELIR